MMKLLIKEIIEFIKYVFIVKPIETLKLLFDMSKQKITLINKTKTWLIFFSIVFVAFVLLDATRSAKVGIGTIIIILFLRYEWIKKDYKGYFRRLRYEKSLQKVNKNA